MKIRRLDLLAFGAFEGASLAFGGAPGIVDLVYGSNEAGKSTTLRAVSGLLFGIPERTEDAHRHAPSELRIRALLESRDGSTLEVVRRKGRKSTLRAPDDSPLDDGVLSPLLLGTTRELYEGLFGLDHERLRASAQALLAGKGNVGESLFAAGIGGRGVHELSERLGREADELFQPRARERKLTRAIAEVKDARDAVRGAATNPSKYLEQERALEDAKRWRETLRAQRTELGAEQARLNRVASTLPGLRRRAELVARLTELGDFVELAENAAETRARALSDIDKAAHEDERAREQEEQCVARLSELVAPEALVDVDDAVISISRDRRGRYNSAQLDCPKLEAKAITIETQVAKSLRTIGALSATSELHVTVAGAARVRHLAAGRGVVRQKLDDVRRTSDDARTRREHLATRLGVSADVLSRLEVYPSVESVERFGVEFARLDSERVRFASDSERRAALKHDVDRRLDELRRVGDVPTEAELTATRTARDERFAELRRATLGERRADSAEVERYETLVRDADTVGDRLRREAGRVAIRSTLEAERAAIDEQGRALDVAAAALAERQATLSGSWLALWRGVGVEPRSPSEMRPWARDAEALSALVPEEARLELEAARAVAELDEFDRAWRVAVESLGLSRDATEGEAFAVIDALAQQARQIDEADSLRRRIEGIARDSTRFAADVVERCRVALPEALHLPPADAAERFIRAVEQARAHRAESQRLEAEVVAMRRARACHVAKRKDAESRLAALMAAARVPDPVALEDAERRSSEGRALRAQLLAVERELVAAGNGMSLDALETEARDRDLDRTRARLAEIGDELEEQDGLREQAVQDIAQLDRGVHSLAHNDAADAAALLEDKIAVMKRHAHRFVRVRLASVLLKREIERYRQENQGPVVSRANELFPRLTVGRYAGLRVGFGEDGEAILLAVRSDGTPVRVDALSDGTRDQLYLALRLASLERYARANEPMPLVLDDVLIHFDDERASAALSVLGDVARTTQVLFFTHHARLVELARRALGSERLAEHAMPESR